MNPTTTKETQRLPENGEPSVGVKLAEEDLAAVPAGDGDMPANDRLEAQVQERTAALRQAVAQAGVERERLRTVLDQLPAYLLLLAPDYRVPFANRYFEERFGKSEGHRCYEYLFHRSEPCLDCQSFQVLKTNAPHRWKWNGPDGRLYDIFDFPFTDVDGSPLIMEVGLDITERQQIEAELARHRAHLEDLVRKRTGQLAETNARLEAEIAARTRAAEDLRSSNEELQRFNRAMVGRELRMVELKREVNELCARTVQPPRYPEGLKTERP